jgi:hypothetical protein
MHAKGCSVELQSYCALAVYLASRTCIAGTAALRRLSTQS